MALLSGVAGAFASAITYCFGSYSPACLPDWLLKIVGYDPATNNDECPMLETPDPSEIENALNVSGVSAGEIVTGYVDLSHYGKGDKHFYLVVANCGNIFEIAERTGLPADTVRRTLTTPLAMLITWAGSMMAGGGAIHLTPQTFPTLAELEMQQAEMNTVIGRGSLTAGYDQVELRNLQRRQESDVVLNSFLARTMYFHSLSGTVLHMQYVARNGDIYWMWVGGGGRGFTSAYVNNPTALDLDLGIWPDMARAIQGLYRDTELVRRLADADPRDYAKLIKELISASQSKRGMAKEVIQRFLVSLGYPARIMSSAQQGSLYGVKGDPVKKSDS